jgi:hypothetical protein
MESEPLMSLQPKSDFELLLWERNKVKAQAEFIQSIMADREKLQRHLDIALSNIKSILASKPNARHQQDLEAKARKSREREEEWRSKCRKLTVENEQLIAKIAQLNLKNLTQ